MDPMTMIAGVVATGVIAGVMLVIAKFSFGGESDYEQQIARQKEILLSDEPRSKGAERKKVNKEKKKNEKKGGAKHVSDKSETEFTSEGGVSGSETDGGAVPVVVDELSHAHIEYDPDPVIIEPVAQTSSKSNKKSKKSAPAKSILHNKAETPLVRSEDAAIAETVFAENAAPKDDLELKHNKTKKGGKKDKKSQAQIAEVPEPVVVEEVMMVSQAKSSYSAPAPAPVMEEMMVAKTESTVSSQPKKSKAKKSAVVAQNDVSAILDTVQQASLSRDELQMLVERILAIQSEDNWTTKGAKPDPVAVLRKQLDEAQAALADEKSNLASAQSKIKEITGKWAHAEKVSSTTGGQVAELQKRMQQTHEQHKQDLASLQHSGYADKQKVEQQEQIMSQLSEENQRLRMSVANTDEVTSMQNQIRDLSAEKQQNAQRKSESDKTIASLKHEVTKLQEGSKKLDGERAESKKRCDELGQKLAQSDNLAQQANNKATEAEKNSKNLQEQLKSQQLDTQQQLQKLKDELKVARETTQRQANGTHTNGSSNGLPSTDNTKLESKISQLEESLSTKEATITNLNKQLTVARNCLQSRNSPESDKPDQQLQTQLTSLQAQIQTLKDKNNELRRKNWALSDSLEKAESSNSSKQNNELESLQEKANAYDGLVKESNELKESLKKLHQTVDQQEQEVEKLRQSSAANGAEQQSQVEQQVSEAVSKAAADHEKKVRELNAVLKKRTGDVSELQCNLKWESDRVAELEASQKQQTEGVATLQSALDDAKSQVASLSDSSSKSNAEVGKLKKELESVRSKNKDLEGKIKDLKTQAPAEPSPAAAADESSSLSQYKNALSEAEKMLDSLSSRVEDEHNKLTAEIRAKDQTISSVQQRLESAEKNSKLATDLEAQLQESHKKVAKLEKSLEEQNSRLKADLGSLESSLKDEQLKNRQLAQHLAAAMAASGGGDDSGTCV